MEYHQIREIHLGHHGESRSVSGYREGAQLAWRQRIANVCQTKEKGKCVHSE